MPYVNLKMSSALADDTSAVLTLALSKVLCEATGKPEKFCMVCVDRAVFAFAGKNGPGAFLDVRGIGGFNGPVNKKLSKGFCDLLAKECGIPADRIYMTFGDVAAENWGFNGSTFG
jgi:phenylpyruvate tautomerase